MSTASPIVSYTGIYNADGGLAGEVHYIVGHLLGTAECALCDITHSPVRRKPEWDRFVAGLAVPFAVLHRNELNAALAQAIRTETLPLVVAHRVDGTVAVVLTAPQLTGLGGSVAEFERALAATAIP